MTIYERFDFILKRVDDKIHQAVIKMDDVKDDPSLRSEYYYQMGRVHALQELRLVITTQIDLHEIQDDLDLALDAIWFKGGETK